MRRRIGDRIGLGLPGGGRPLRMETNNMSQHRMKRIGTLGLVVLVITAALGCNTAQGFGKDMEKAGQKIQQGTD